MNKKIEIDLRTKYHSTKLFSMLVWQELYNIYSASGGDLKHLNNLLCDLCILQEYFKEERFVLYWYFCGSLTVMEDFEESHEDEYKITYIAKEQTVTIEKCENKT